MFLITVKAPTMEALREKLLEAARGMGHVEVIIGAKPQGEDEELGYGDDAEAAPLQTAVYTPHEGVAKPAMPTFQPIAEVGKLESPAGTVAPTMEAVTAHLAGGDRDSRGLPWDERIHASSKAKTKDGQWRIKRGVDEKFLADVEFQLRSQAQAAPASQPVPLPVAPAPVPLAPAVQHGFVPALPPAAMALPTPAPAPLPLTSQPVYAPQPAQAPIAAVPTPAPAPSGKPAHTLESFKANIIPTFVQLVGAGSVTQHYIEQLKEYFQVKEIWDVQNDAKKLQELFDNFVASGLITRIG